MNIKEESLRKALHAVGLSSLPKQYTANSREFWLKAIVLVQKRNLEENYCLYDRKPSGLMELVRDFGHSSVIFSIKSIHPYLYFDERRFIPEDRSYEDKKMFLLHELDKDDKNFFNIPTMSEEQLDKVIFEHGISKQLENLDEDLMLNAMNSSPDDDLEPITEEDEQKYRSDLFAMIRNGHSQDEIAAFREAFEKRKEAQAKREKDVRLNNYGNDVTSDADMLRAQMEALDEAEFSASQPILSSAGEFDAPKIDYKQIKADTEEYKHEQLKMQKRRWKREHDGTLLNRAFGLGNDNNYGGFESFENETGDAEEVETLQLPENQSQKGIMESVKADIEPKTATSLTASGKKRGRPRKTDAKKATTRRKTTTSRKRQSTRAKKA